MKNYTDKEVSTEIDAPTFNVILGGIQESTVELQAALISIRDALYRLNDTVPIQIEEPINASLNPRDFVGQLIMHSDKLIQLRAEAIEISKKINSLI